MNPLNPHIHARPYVLGRVCQVVEKYERGMNRL